MFAPDAIAMALSVVGAAMPALGKALALRMRERKEKKRADLLERQKSEMQREAVVYDIAQAPASSHAQPLLRFLIVLVVALTVTIVVATLNYAPTPSRTPAPQGVGFWELISRLSRHEAFYQLLFLFAILLFVFLARHKIAALARRLDPSGQLLLGFAFVVLCFGGSAAIHFWNQISVTADKMYLALGLFFTMVAGMFVQVITSNYKAGASSLFAVTTAQLVYPVLFSPIVYYAIWAVASVSSSVGLFSFYAAFLNGYFWQSVVTSAQKVSVARGTP